MNDNTRIHLSLFTVMSTYFILLALIGYNLDMTPAKNISAIISIFVCTSPFAAILWIYLDKYLEDIQNIPYWYKWTIEGDKTRAYMSINSSVIKTILSIRFILSGQYMACDSKYIIGAN